MRRTPALLFALAVLVIGQACAPSTKQPGTAKTQAVQEVAGLDDPADLKDGAVLNWPPSLSWIAPPSAQPRPDPALAALPSPQPLPPPDGLHHPAGSPYRALAHGYDASWPQCNAGRKPAGSFGIIGINGGKAFTLNPCFPELMKAAPAGAQIYLNTGFNPKNAPRLIPYCTVEAQKLVGASALQKLAYGLGCSTTEDTLGVMRSFHIAYPAIWWLDVEETNSWDDAHPLVNRYSIQGQLDVLAQTGKTIAVYSTFPDWQQITGGHWGSPLIKGNWVAGRTPQFACSQPGFSGAPVWLAQELATWPGSGYDSDYAC